MPTEFHHRPDSRDMVTEVCGPTTTDLLCVACGWQGHAEIPDAPWTVFQTHECRLSFETVGRFS